MSQLIVSILIISGIGALFALLLELADLFIANYGECRISINQEKELVVQGGNPLLFSLMEEGIFIPSACGGKGTCAYCKVKVLDGGGPILPTETPYLSEDEQAENVRLSCQVKVRNDLKIEIPEELFLVKEFDAVVEKITDLTHDIKAFRFALREPAEITFTPGQYVQLLTPKYDQNSEEVYRAYSVSSDAAETGHVELVIRLVPGGICTTYCFEHLEVGDAVKFNGPYGEFGLSDTDAGIIFIAGGSGMAPIECQKRHGTRTSTKAASTGAVTRCRALLGTRGVIIAQTYG